MSTTQWITNLKTFPLLSKVQIAPQQQRCSNTFTGAFTTQDLGSAVVRSHKELVWCSADKVVANWVQDPSSVWKIYCQTKHDGKHVEITEVKKVKLYTDDVSLSFFPNWKLLEALLFNSMLKHFFFWFTEGLPLFHTGVACSATVTKHLCWGRSSEQFAQRVISDTVAASLPVLSTIFLTLGYSRESCASDICVRFLLESKERFSLKLLEVQLLHHLSLEASRHCTGAFLMGKMIKKRSPIVSSDLHNRRWQWHYHNTVQGVPTRVSRPLLSAQS